MKTMLINRKTGKEFKDVQVVTVDTINNIIWITTSETLSNPHGSKTRYDLDDIEISISNRKESCY